MVDLVGIEPTTSSMPWKRAPSCATGPQTHLSLLSLSNARIVNGESTVRGLSSRQSPGKNVSFQRSVLTVLLALSCVSSSTDKNNPWVKGTPSHFWKGTARKTGENTDVIGTFLDSLRPYI
jgi:hypothetical protein